MLTESKTVPIEHDGACQATPRGDPSSSTASSDTSRPYGLYELAAILGLIAIPLWLFGDHLLGTRLWIGNFDRLNSSLSVHLSWVRQMHAREVFAWDPMLFMGINTYGFAYIFPNPLTWLAGLAPIDQVYWVAGYISCGLLAAAGIAAFLLVRDSTTRALPAFVGAALYELSASSILRVSQNDTTFEVWIHLPLGLLLLRRLGSASALRTFIGLTLLLASLLTFTFLQESAYAVMLLAVFAAYRSIRARSPRHVLILAAALLVAGVAASPRIVSVATEFGQLNRVAARPFDEVYEFQNVRAREVARWLDNGIFGRFQSETVALGNNINLSEGILLHSSVFAVFIVLAGMVRMGGRWLGLARSRDPDGMFHLVVLLGGLALVFRPVAAVVHGLAFGVEFTHSRAAVAALPGLSVLIALWLDTALPWGPIRLPGALPRFLTRAVPTALLGASIVLAGAMLASLTSLALRTDVVRISTAESPEFFLAQNLQLITTGQFEFIPEPPATFDATLHGLNRAVLTWADVPGESNYRIEMSTGEQPFAEIGRTGPEVTTYAVGNLSFGYTYTFRARACNDRECGDPSASASLAIPAVPLFVPFDATRPPGHVTTTVLAVGSVEVAWEDVSGEDRYLIELQDASSGFREIATVPFGAISYIVSGLSPSARYEFRLRACAGDVCSPHSEVSAATPRRSDRSLVQPRTLEAIRVAPDLVVLDWPDVDAADSYLIEMKPSTSPEPVEIGRVDASRTRYDVGGLDPASSYEFRVRACAEDLCSERSSAGVVEPVALVAPDPPTQLESLVFAPGQVAIAWGPVTTANRYVVEMWSAGSARVKIGETTGRQAQYAISDLSPQSTYFFDVSACVQDVCSDPSASLAVTPVGVPASTQLPPPSVPAMVSDGEMPTIAWPAVPAAQMYIIEGRHLVDAPFQSLGTTATPEMTLPASPDGPPRDVRIRACDTAGCSFASTPLQLQPTSIVFAVPRDLRLEILDRNGVQASWNRVPNADRYRVEVRDRDDGAYSYVDEFEAPVGAASPAAARVTRTIPPDQISNSTAIRVRACRADRCSVSTSAAYLAAQPTWRRPTAPTLRRVYEADASTLVVEWAAVDRADQYDIVIHPAGATEPLVATRVSATSTSYTVSGLQLGTVYLVHLRSCLKEVCSASPTTTADLQGSFQDRQASDAPRPDVTWIRAASLLHIEYSALVFGVLLGSALLLRRLAVLRGLPILILASLLVLDSVSAADLQLRGEQTLNAPAPFVTGDSFNAEPDDLRLPSAEAVMEFNRHLQTESARSVLLCDGKSAPAICTEHVGRFWEMRLVDGESMGIPARLAALPWPPSMISRRVIQFDSADTLPWGILGLLNVRQAVSVDVPLYLNRTRPDGRPAYDAAVVQNPQAVAPRQFFAAQTVAAATPAEAVQRLFPGGAYGPTPDITVTSVVEGLPDAQSFDTDGTITAAYAGDEISVELSPSSGRRFLVLNELFHPGWHAYVDGSEIPIYPTNVVMRGLVIEPGVRHVTLRFESTGGPGVSVIAMTALTVALALLALGWRVVQRRRVSRGQV